jgi:RNA polymerase sigma-70 factor (ECF subfamily)
LSASEGRALDSTSASLLQRLRQPGEGDAWDRFARLYTPLLLSWAQSRYGLQPADAEDLVQDLLADLLIKLRGFQYDPGRSFRAWLGTLLYHKWADRKRPLRQLPLGAEVPAAPPEPNTLEAQDRQLLLRRALELMQAEFEATTWKACWAVVVEDRPAAEVAAELGVSPNAVYIARSRVLRRLRQEFEGLLE